MNRNVALRYAHDAVARCIDHWMADTFWLFERFSEEDYKQVVAEIEKLRLRHVYASTELPAPKPEAEG